MMQPPTRPSDGPKRRLPGGVPVPWLLRGDPALPRGLGPGEQAPALVGPRPGAGALQGPHGEQLADGDAGAFQARAREPGSVVHVRADGVRRVPHGPRARLPHPRHPQAHHGGLVRLRRGVPREHHRRGRQDHPAGAAGAPVQGVAVPSNGQRGQDRRPSPGARARRVGRSDGAQGRQARKVAQAAPSSPAPRRRKPRGGGSRGGGQGAGAQGGPAGRDHGQTPRA
mmetsp:Transcript_19276/g.43688  ORF Transcript_19276/g.43688 Transcript_19276/m.43688 type:complete len:226 (+) Transcript_19276:61-738(+)